MRALPAGLIPVILTSSAFAQPAEPTRAPSFEDYSVREVYRGPAARLVLDAPDERAYRTRIREAVQEGMNFAGHYVMATWGCGVVCTMGAVVDLRTGAVTMLPFTICCYQDDVNLPIEYGPDSRLVVFTGRRNEKGTYGRHYYRFDRGRFRHLKTLPSEAPA
jgi:hypothetical protein